MTAPIDAITRSRVLPVLRCGDGEIACRTALAAADAGLAAVEITLDTPGALPAIERLADEGLTVGAGTVLSPGQVDEATSAGASFVVSPVNPPGFVAAARRAGAAAIPGFLTPSELSIALADRPDAVKLYPAAAVGWGFLSQLRIVSADMPIIPTGGIAAEAAEINAWLDAGAPAVGIGGGLGFVTHDGAREDFTARLGALLQGVSGGA